MNEFVKKFKSIICSILRNNTNVTKFDKVSLQTVDHFENRETTPIIQNCNKEKSSLDYLATPCDATTYSSPSNNIKQITSKLVNPLDSPVNVNLKDIHRRLSKLGEIATSEFYNHKKHSDYFTEEDILRLEAMEKSHSFAINHQAKLNQIDISALENIPKTEAKELEAKEILFLYYINGKNTEKLNIAGHWTHKYHLDYQKVLTVLFQYRYLTFGNICSTLSTYTVKDIKEFLKKYGLPISGKKQDLIDRIVDNCPETKIIQAFPNKVFKLTPTGQMIIDSYECIIYFHKRSNYFNTPIDFVKRLHEQNPNLTTFELAMHIFESECNKHLSEKNYGLYRNSLYCLSLVYKDMNDLHNELCKLMQICYIDICGFSNGGQESIKHSFLAPGILNSIKYSEYYNNIPKQELYTFYVQSINDLPFKSKTVSYDKTFSDMQLKLDEIL